MQKCSKQMPYFLVHFSLKWRQYWETGDNISLDWDKISKIGQNSSCDTIPRNRTVEPPFFACILAEDENVSVSMEMDLLGEFDPPRWIGFAGKCNSNAEEFKLAMFLIYT